MDTNVLSEPLKASPAALAMDWLRAREEDDLFVSVVSLAEIRRGVAKLEDGRRKMVLLRWLER